MTKFLTSSGILLTVLLLVFGLGYYAKGNNWPLPPVVKQYIPETGKVYKKTTKDSYEQGGGRRIGQEVGEDKYILPVGVSINEFARCLKSRVLPLIEDRDFHIEKRSNLIRVLIPISRAREGAISAGYEKCRSQFARR